MDTDHSDIPLYKVNPKDGSELVLVPGGWFWMGSGDEDPEAYENEKPRHLHYVEPFYFGIACVTVEQFQRFTKVTSNESEPSPEKNSKKHPVQCVSWKDASAYCEWAGLRLPTEAEWELAARGYGALKYPWGSEWEGGRRLSWGPNMSHKEKLAPVFAQPEGVSRFGTFQQSGNLWEWCEDSYDARVYDRYARGDFRVASESNLRVLRGGSVDTYSYILRSGYRGQSFLDYCNYDCGFRVAQTAAF